MFLGSSGNIEIQSKEFFGSFTCSLTNFHRFHIGPSVKKVLLVC